MNSSFRRITVRHGIRAAAVLTILGLAVSCNKKPEALALETAEPEDNSPLFAAPTFKLTDQDGQSFSSDELKGKTWIATLFFTSCSGPCPMMSMRLRDIQKAVADPNVMLVSFSVDPKRDTPAALKDYSRNMSADPKRWKFLCGNAADTQKVADGLKLGYESAGDNSGQIVHSTRFLLVDKAGQVRGIYSTDEDASMEKLKADARKLAAS